MQKQIAMTQENLHMIMMMHEAWSPNEPKKIQFPNFKTDETSWSITEQIRGFRKRHNTYQNA